MIKIMATNHNAKVWPKGEQFLYLRAKGLMFFAQLSIYSPDGKYDTSYRDVEDFMSEWTNIKYMESVDDTVEFGLLKLSGAV